MVVKYKEGTKTVLLDIINSSLDFKVSKKPFRVVFLSVDKASKLFYSGRLGSLDDLSRPAHPMLNRTYCKCLYKALKILKERHMV